VIQTPLKIPEETTEQKNDAHKAMEIQADNINFPSNWKEGKYMAKRHPKEKKSKKEVVTKEREKEQAPDEREALKAVRKGPRDEQKVKKRK